MFLCTYIHFSWHHNDGIRNHVDICFISIDPVQASHIDLLEKGKYLPVVIIVAIIENDSYKSPGPSILGLHYSSLRYTETHLPCIHARMLLFLLILYSSYVFFYAQHTYAYIHTIIAARI